MLFDGSLNADKTRSEDPLALYPVWRVGIALDKWYGNMYGVQVDIWADTGEVRRVQEAWSSMPPPEGAPTANLTDQESLTSETNVNMAMLIVLPAFAIVWIGGKKKLHYYNLLKKQRGFKAGGILLCILISSTIFLGSLSTVSATTRGAVVWGSESTEAGVYTPYPELWLNWRKSRPEIDAQRLTANYLEQFFEGGGYTGNNGINHQGINNPGSSKNQIISDLSTLQNYHDYVAVVDFNHGVGRDDYSAVPPGEFHYMFEDNYGTVWGPDKDHQEQHPEHGVYDADLYYLTSPSKVIFAFISTCMSADLSYGQGMLPPQMPPYPGRALGMPFAWTHRLVADKSSTPGFTITQHISDDGYADPDWGTQVYIGFVGGSASLEQSMPNGNNPYYYWVCSFLGHALLYGQSVNEALNTASLQFMGCYFSGTVLRTGFTPYWWNYPGQWPTSTLAIYGNGNIHLRYYTSPADVATPRFVSGPTAGEIGVSYEFSGFATDPYAHSIQYRFDWGDGSPYTETGWYSDGAFASASHSWSSGNFYNIRIQARCPNSGWSAWSEPLVINIGNQPVYHWLTVEAIDGILGYPLYPDIYIDGNYAGYGYVSVQVLEGWHSVWMDDPTWNGYWQYWSYLSYYSDYYGNGDYRPVYSDTYITAVYD